MPNEGPAHNIVSDREEKKLFFVLLLTALIMVVEVAGGYISGSLAILADAGHMFTDVASLGLSWFAIHYGRRAPDNSRTFGYQRLKILAAYTNGILLFFLSGIIGTEAIQRITNPEPINGPLMLIIAGIGFATNLFSFFILKSHDTHDHGHNHGHDHGHDHDHDHGHEHIHARPHKDLNLESASLHVLTDMFGSVAALVAGIIVMTTGWSQADPLLSLLVCGLIVMYAIGLVRKTTHILIEGAPNPDLPKKIRETILANVKGVTDVHHIHVWSLTETQTLATMDVTVDEQVDGHAALCAIRKVLEEKLGLDHVTVQIEKGPCFGFDL